MLTLLLGTAGTGKSAHLTEEIARDLQDGYRVYLIIPEQQANLTERTLLPKLPTGNRHMLSVAGFSRLAKEIETQYGCNNDPQISEGMQCYTMWRALRDADGALLQYKLSSGGGEKERTARSAIASELYLAEMVLNTLGQLRASAITPAILSDCAMRLAQGEQKDSVFTKKIADLSLLGLLYEDKLSSLFGGKTNDPVAHLAKLCEEHPLFANSRIYIDSFTSFTSEEYAVLAYMLRQADRVCITFTCDKKDAVCPAFSGIHASINRLRHFCSAENIRVQIDSLENNLRTDRADLQFLAESLWDFSLPSQIREKKSRLCAKCNSISLLSCTNLYAEAEAIALHILDLFASGYRYGDIAITVRDTSSWRGVLDAALARYGIPYYFAEKTALTDAPLARLLLSSLLCVAHDFRTEDVLTVLKTGLCPVEEADIDFFMQYIATWEITGKDFLLGEWKRSAGGYYDSEDPGMAKKAVRFEAIRESANRVRKRMIDEALLPFSVAVKSAQNAKDFCRAIYEYMEQLHLRDACACRAEEELKNGYLKEAGETLRMYDTVMQVLVELTSLQADAVFANTEEFATVLRMFFSHTQVASVPSLHDSVTIGSADTLRVENIKVAFVAGLCESEFPRAARGLGLLSDADRDELSENGLVTDKSADQEADDELLYLYRAMTKPSHRLFLSTQETDTSGKVKSPSLAWNRVLYLLPNLQKQIRHHDLSLLEHAKAELAEKKRQEDVFAVDTTNTAPLQLSRECIRAITGGTLYLSQTKIAAFVNCPYRYYCQYVLGLEEPVTTDPNAADMGTFLHYILERFVQELCFDADKNPCLPPQDMDFERFVGQKAECFLQQYGYAPGEQFLSLHRYNRLRQISILALRNTLTDLYNGDFKPVETEYSFRTEVELNTQNKAVIRGKIDRIDTWKQGDTTYLRVIDYKTSAHSFSEKNALSGKDVQLPLYLSQLCDGQTVKPAGGLFHCFDAGSKQFFTRSGFFTEDEQVIAAADKSNSGIFCGSKKDNVILDENGMHELTNGVQTAVKEIGEKILSGGAERTPSEAACGFCPYIDACPDAYHTLTKKGS